MLRMACKQSRTALNFSKYDFIGFDFDNTLCTYNLKNLFTNHYNYLAAYLNRKRYNIPTEISSASIDFISRGLIIDIEGRNLLKVTDNGEIVKACHGTKKLSMEDIARQYGKEKKWRLLNEIICTNFQDWKTKSETVYSFMDFTDAAFTAIYALAVDSGFNARRVWDDVYDGIKTMYDDQKWMDEVYGNNNFTYVNKISEKVINWVKQLKKTSKVAIITSNSLEAIEQVAKRSIGADWKSLFDFIVYEAKKPGFFTRVEPFFDLDGKETTFCLNGSYTRGCMSTIQDTLAKQLKRSPLCLYVGDSPYHDFMFTQIDYVAVVEELKAEKNLHPSSKYISSSMWGSYLREGEKPTLFGKYALNSKFCTPDLDYFAEHPVNHEFVTEWQ